MRYFRKYSLLITAILLLVLTALIWQSIYFKGRSSNVLKVAFLDIGQGDSIYIEAPNGKQMLVDGGSGQAVLAKLSQVMPFGDRSIDILLVTHTDADHIGGFPFVLENYKVGKVIENGAKSTTKVFANMEDSISKYNIGKIVAHKGMRIVLDKEKNIYFDILFPDRDIAKMESNDGSIVGKLVYGGECFMLTGDATIYTENLIMQTENEESLHCQVLKLGHHGSKTSSSELWLEAVRPDTAIISAGKDNKYGHPSGEVLDKLEALNIPYLSTVNKGTIMFETDGQRVWYNN